MLYELALFLTALAGSAIGGWIDFKTTEIPDIVPLSMAALGISIHAINAYFTGAWSSLYYSLGVGILFLIFGYILYYTGQWGEADVLLLAAVGVIIPQPLSFFSRNLFMEAGLAFPLVFIMNTFLVGGLYSLIYSAAVAAKNKAVIPEFSKEVRRSSGLFFRIAAILFFASLLLIVAFSRQFNVLFSFPFFLYNFTFLIPTIAFIFLFYVFAKTIDNVAFKAKVKTKDLKEGDVLAEGAAGFSGKLYVGLTAGQIKKIRKARKEVWIKEGIRYGPTFFLTLIATWLFGNVIVWLIRIL